MAVHASLRRGNAGETGSLNRSVAVTAVDAQASDMVLMAERSGLRPGHPCISHIWGALKIDAGPECECERENTRINRSPRGDVSAAMENLHRSGFFFTAESECDPSLYWKICSSYFKTDNY